VNNSDYEQLNINKYCSGHHWQSGNQQLPHHSVGVTIKAFADNQNRLPLKGTTCSHDAENGHLWQANKNNRDWPPYKLTYTKSSNFRFRMLLSASVLQ
jgi:hypothetical protein